jgi:2-dehydro-3-deoxyglucarate aldolase/4-hydroxy-2-oxoheptanedioate aldolase
MPPAHATFLERLAAREPLTGTILTLPSPEAAEIFAAAGFDWLFVDMEHGLLDFPDVQRVVQAVAARCACLVRVPSNEPIWINKALDTGAAGVIVPHVDGPAQARAAVRAAKYPPSGERSIGVARAQAFGRRLTDAIAHANDETVLVAQAEHADAARSIDEIVTVPGLGAIFIGPFDMSASLGLPGRLEEAAVREAINRVRDGCGRRGVPCGILVADATAARAAFSAGYSLVCVATDTLLLGRVAAEVIKAVTA